MSVSYFHDGELKVQAEAGTDSEHYKQAAIEMMPPALKPNEEAFVNSLTFSAAATVDADGRPWVSPLFGPAGRLFEVQSPTVVRISTPHRSGDPLAANVKTTGQIGVLYFDPSKRRRSKSIGNGSFVEGGVLRYEMTRNFGLCPKYIFKRNHEPAPFETQAGEAIEEMTFSSALSTKDMTQLAETDTLFLGSYHVANGADATHRGGKPGFVTVVDDRTIRIPDYLGNGMFNTLGNLVIDPRLALMTVDFVSGRSLHLTGSATVDRQQGRDPERVITINVDRITVSNHPVGTWTDIEPSRFNPDY